MTDREMIAHILRMVEGQGEQLTTIQKVMNIQELDKDFQALSEARVGFVADIKKLKKVDVPGLQEEMEKSRGRLNSSRELLKKESWRSLLRHGVVWLLVALIVGPTTGLGVAWYMTKEIESTQHQKLEKENWSYRNRSLLNDLGYGTEEERRAIGTMSDCIKERSESKKDPEKMPCLPLPPKIEKSEEKPKSGKSKRGKSK